MNKWKVGALIVVGMMFLYCLINVYAIYSLLVNYNISQEALDIYRLEMTVYGFGILLGFVLFLIVFTIRNEDRLQTDFDEGSIAVTDSVQ